MNNLVGLEHMSREADLDRFYSLLNALSEKLGGSRTLDKCDGRMAWPNRGVYFFFEPGENRDQADKGHRVVRVGTHALKAGSRTSLWQRLSQHRGTSSGGGNHRGSIFRLLLGDSLKGSGLHLGAISWDIANDASKAAAQLGIAVEDVKLCESPIEASVSKHIRSLPFLWLGINDEAGPSSDRGVIERNSIALLSNYGKAILDMPSAQWLGNHCTRERVRLSGLWNNNHVDGKYDPAFLTVLEGHILKTSPT